jgi:hypothetical protein
MRSGSFTYRPGGELHGQDVGFQSTFDHWYVSRCRGENGLMNRDDMYRTRSSYGWDLYDFRGLYRLSRSRLWDRTWMCRSLLSCVNRH